MINVNNHIGYEHLLIRVFGWDGWMDAVCAKRVYSVCA